MRGAARRARVRCGLTCACAMWLDMRVYGAGYNRVLCALQTAHPLPCSTSGAQHLAARVRRGAARVHPAIVQLSTRDVCSARRLCLADGNALVAQRRPAAT
eukprot:1958972-Pleurochrysis_carterae.AAC.2